MRYDFICKSCNIVDEVTRSYTDTSEVLCKVCKTKMTRIYDVPKFILKGDGYYSTDNR